MISRHLKTSCFGTSAALVALAIAACIASHTQAGRVEARALAAPAPAADNSPVLANRTLVPKAVRLVIGFRPTATT